MPNTIAHIAVQTLISRGLLRGADFKWILAGCVLPDIPWIAQRAVAGLAPEFPAIPLRLYTAVQSSLIVTLILGVALAFLSRRPVQTFAILALGVVLHLLLDATQTKWANGVLLFAPFSWDLLNFGLYWPESSISLGLSVLGAGIAVHAFQTVKPVRGGPVLRPAIRPLSAAALILVWLVLPALLVPVAQRTDLHQTATLAPDAQRVGQPIEFDRAPVQAAPDGAMQIQAWTGETFGLWGRLVQDAQVVSLRGVFVAHGTVAVEDIFVHSPGWRAILSQIGLLIVALWWFRCLRPGL